MRLKAVILAAGQGERAGVGYPKILQPLGDKKIIEYVVENALHFVAPSDLYVVVGYQREKVQEHLGAAYNYVVQEEALGTGHAVLQVYPLLNEYGGDLLILYGDTPLFRTSSIRGLINRHRLKEATLTLFSAVVDKSLPYGRIIRDGAGRIVGIIEEADASPEIKSIRELNVGAYVVRASALFPALEQLDRDNIQGEYLLTDSVRHLIRLGHGVESYQTCDEDETLGINTPHDLRQAECVLQKRLHGPRRIEWSSNLKTYAS
jgi:bifunctional UDP-N-acetylglucosamine pyrophosphorylase/glucosamine-1-phosphate N-acetyltransferase